MILEQEITVFEAGLERQLDDLVEPVVLASSGKRLPPRVALVQLAAFQNSGDAIADRNGALVFHLNGHGTLDQARAPSLAGCPSRVPAEAT